MNMYISLNNEYKKLVMNMFLLNMLNFKPSRTDAEQQGRR